MLIDPIKAYTYKDYLTYDENERIEIIEGEIINMSPAPSRIHQEIISELHFKLKEYIKYNNGSCKVYPAPFDVILKDDDDEVINSKNIVQPDISVICDKNKLTEKGCTGSPDMIVEVISPYNPSNDYVRKLNLYEKFKVKEYWIVNPTRKNILVYVLTENGYDAPITYTFSDKVKVNIYDNFEIDFNSIDID
ncbi:Uma2 family endonuclease [Clostridium beijerinckii]|uniref:Uma2 family endonuclease n=1 Tax=Clostridium beijerinckii TaxID=1520 RepID=UPI001494153E|nr:Uma2 family endonuclease [Clostridium beijerinckii]NOW91036.1 Uma2 family endonuclease [Clostridium beijerinckii]